jgi:hypothetical protein
MAASLPEGFYAQTLQDAYPASTDYFITLYPTVPTSLDDADCGVETKRLSGYRIEDQGSYAALHFDRTVDWLDVTVRARGALIHDNTRILSIMDFEKDVGVIGGIFTVQLNDEGVIYLGEKNDI